MMEEFQHILVPVDGSEPSVRALEKAVWSMYATVSYLHLFALWQAMKGWTAC